LLASLNFGMENLTDISEPQITHLKGKYPQINFFYKISFGKYTFPS